MSKSPAVLPPHPRLGRYYKSDEERPDFVDDMFDEGAPAYEWVCRVMSLGTGGQYRKQALRAAGLEPGMRVLDVATGTGLVLRPASELSGGRSLTIGLDPSVGMLRECRKRSAALLVQGRGEALPFRDEHFDMVSMGYGLRHVADLHALFREYRRVLKPGGRVLLLEITQPATAFGRRLNRAFLGTLIPGVARLWKGVAAAQMMEYFWDTVENCVPPDAILSALRSAGFPGAARTVTGGILSEYLAVRPL
jgi:demethylmenaquinone methyltransferase / 2-methoxy-6-polyprenyl-1,4-benzoquinol methylase